MDESKSFGEGEKQLPGATTAAKRSNRQLASQEQKWHRIKIGFLLIAGLFILLTAARYVRNHRAPNDVEMAEHFSGLSPNCQKIASAIIKGQMLDNQRALNNAEITQTIATVNSGRCSEIADQTAQIDRVITTTITTESDTSAAIIHTPLK